ncbi:MAG: DJ-1/PfpI family protein [Sneathiellales bacterium]|nr:DJ-1/PfpI family protein [Sneathiellales bacterium]
MTHSLHIGFLIFPDVTQLDATGPVQILAMLPGAHIHMVWKNLDLVPTDAGFSIAPTDTFASCPPLDVICIPGGLGQRAVMKDPEVLDFVKKQGEQARYVTSVCSGSLLLGAAGLLKGYRAGAHWVCRDLLEKFGAEPVKERVVIDRNRITGGGVTAGIDFGLLLAAELADEETAKGIQLAVEYDPHPPFNAGTPEGAGAELTEKIRQFFM